MCEEKRTFGKAWQFLHSRGATEEVCCCGKFCP